MSGTLGKIMDVLANLGFVMRDTQRAKVAEGSREWGEAVDGYALSVHVVEPYPTLSVALKNVTAEERRAVLPGWFQYYAVTMTGPDGESARLTAFGRRLLSEEGARVEVVFRPGEPVTTEIPLATVYDMRTAGEYRVWVSCAVPGSGAVARSNVVTVRTKAI